LGIFIADVQKQSYIIIMGNKMKLYVLIFAAVLLSSCGIFGYGEKETTNLYYKCFFLGETSFLIEGEAFYDTEKVASSYHEDNPIYAEPFLTESFPFDSLVARISSKSASVYKEWEIPAIKLSESKFQLPVDITANGITIDKDTLSVPPFYNNTFSGSFPAFELKFYFNDRKYVSSSPVFQEKDENNEYRCYWYSYVYVAEPADLSWTYKEGNFYNINKTVIHHYDFNFSKPGWYKIININGYHREIDDDPKFFTGENTYFLF